MLLFQTLHQKQIQLLCYNLIHFHGSKLFLIFTAQTSLKSETWVPNRVQDAQQSNANWKVSIQLAEPPLRKKDS